MHQDREQEQAQTYARLYPFGDGVTERKYRPFSGDEANLSSDDQPAWKMTDDTQQQFGWLAATFGKRLLRLEVRESKAGFYLGTRDESGSPFSRESRYWPTREEAERALTTRDWKQRLVPEGTTCCRRGRITRRRPKLGGASQHISQSSALALFSGRTRLRR